MNQTLGAYYSVKHHLVTLPVLDLVVQVLRQVQTLVNVLLKSYCALQGKKASFAIVIKLSIMLQHLV